ncbi:MAG: tetratricopeptide repeat protein [Deltaproteobacteria bacterium]|nr:tetratricopeptide repeat protein [Deltaproteobacteria bacterium]MBN2674255.1 tetratricopeptide repeat protein [Deltaproteobacteria bacterium]
MTQRTDSSIRRLVAMGKYEEALNVEFGAERASIARAHIRQLHRHSHSESAREALNQAKTVLLDESIERKTQRLMNLGELDSAFTLLESNLSDSPTAYEYYMLGYILYRMGRYAESVTYMEKAFDMTASAFHAIWFGCVLERQGEMKRALEKYVFAIEKRGNETEHRMAGNLYFHLCEYQSAMRHLAKAISLGCKDEDVFEKIAIMRQKQKMLNFKRRVRNFFRFQKSETIR